MLARNNAVALTIEMQRCMLSQDVDLRNSERIVKPDPLYPPRNVTVGQEDASAAGVSAPALPVASRKPEPIFGSFLTQMLDPAVSVNDRVTDLFAAAVGKVISKMYESLGERGGKAYASLQ